jgi:TMEM175 potassium channel family protein
MTRGRLEAFSDGVIAILITIMVLNLNVPAGSTWSALGAETPVLLSYVLSFVFLGIYWNNHHHLMSATSHVSGGVLWANLHLLFWLSLVPFETHWMEASGFAAVPTATYGIVLLMAAVAFTILVRMLVHVHGRESKIAQAIGADYKGKVSVGLYLAAIPLSFATPYAAVGIYVVVALMWLIPDRRFEQHRHH